MVTAAPEVVCDVMTGIFGINEYEQSLMQTLFTPFTVIITCGDGATEYNILYVTGSNKIFDENYLATLEATFG
jgi:hypothetical protein